MWIYIEWSTSKYARTSVKTEKGVCRKIITKTFRVGLLKNHCRNEFRVLAQVWNLIEALYWVWWLLKIRWRSMKKGLPMSWTKNKMVGFAGMLSRLSSLCLNIMMNVWSKVSVPVWQFLVIWTRLIFLSPRQYSRHILLQCTFHSCDNNDDNTAEGRGFGGIKSWCVVGY